MRNKESCDMMVIIVTFATLSKINEKFHCVKAVPNSELTVM